MHCIDLRNQRAYFQWVRRAVRHNNMWACVQDARRRHSGGMLVVGSDGGLQCVLMSSLVEGGGSVLL